MKRAIISTIISIIIVIVLIAAWYLASPLFFDDVVDEALVFEPVETVAVEDQTEDVVETPEVTQPAQETIAVTHSGTFSDADSFHKVSGSAEVISNGESRVLRLEDFAATNGPDLKVYLASDAQATEYVSLGELKGNIGDQNYNLPADVEIEKYPKVLIWCEQFSVLFGSADLR